MMGLAPSGRPNRFKPLVELNEGELDVPDWKEELNQPFLPESPVKWEVAPA